VDFIPRVPRNVLQSPRQRLRLKRVYFDAELHWKATLQNGHSNVRPLFAHRLDQHCGLVAARGDAFGYDHARALEVSGAKLARACFSADGGKFPEDQIKYGKSNGKTLHEKDTPTLARFTPLPHPPPMSLTF
jgi:hypothetical protein